MLLLCCDRGLLKELRAGHKGLFSGRIKALFGGANSSRQKKDLSRPLVMRTDLPLPSLPRSMLLQAQPALDGTNAIEIMLDDVQDLDELW